MTFALANKAQQNGECRLSNFVPAAESAQARGADPQLRDLQREG